MSVECPRNVFPARSGPDDVVVQAEGPFSPVASLKETASQEGVRERSARHPRERTHTDRFDDPAHRSNRLITQLNATWRVVYDPLQWRLQRRKGNPRSKNSGWRDRSFCTTREGLLRCVREYCDVDPAAVAKLAALPEHHALTLNLDVHGTAQTHAEVSRSPCFPRHRRCSILTIARPEALPSLSIS